MNEPIEDRDHDQGDDTLRPLPGEPGIPNVAQTARATMPRKELLAVALAVLSLAAISAIAIQRYAASDRKPDDATSKRAGDRPAAATAEPRRFDLNAPPVTGSASAVGSTTRIPSIIPTDEEAAEPIGVHRTGQRAPTSSGPKAVPPEDAPIVLVSGRPATTGSPALVGSKSAQASDQNTTTPSGPLDETRRNLEAYERQLQVLLVSLTRSSTTGGGPPPAVSSTGGTASGGAPSAGAATAQGGPAAGGLFGGQLQSSATPRVAATMLGNRSLILPKGTAFTCALKTKVVSAASGFVSCLVQRNVYGDDGRVLLIERGSQVDGEYRIASLKPGTVRIPALWTRIKTPNGVTVDIDSPGTGPLGESGVDGYVDNRWGERIGAAMLLSLIDDSVQLALQHESSTSQSNAVVLPSTTSNTSKLAEKVLDSTINIPPLIYQNQGGIVGVYVARDVDFSSVYELQPSLPGSPR